MNRMEQNFIEKLKLEFENIKDENGNYEYAKFRHITDKLYMECLALEDIEYKTKYQKLGAGENPYTVKSNLNEPSVGDYITPEEMAQLEAAIANSPVGQESNIRMYPISGAVEEVNTEKPQLQGEPIDVVQARQKAMSMLKPMLEDDNVKATMEELEYLEILNCVKKDYNGWYIKHDPVNNGTQLVQIEVSGIYKKDKYGYRDKEKIVIYLKVKTEPFTGESDTLILNWSGRNDAILYNKYGKRIATL